MKKVLSTIVAFVLTIGVFAQTPQKMSYQAVIRNTSNVLVANQTVGMRVSILQGSPTGTEVYKETYSPNPLTNANGLVTIQIGSGIPVTGNFSDINWSAGPYFIKTETDPTGGSDYSITGTSQLLSVPYAMYANTVASYSETDPVFVASPAYGIVSTNISNWNTAYSWGNHATAGYITSFTETDPIFGTWNKSSGISITASQVSDFQTNVTNNTAVLLNTAKVTNATHTGDVTGSGALTLATVNSDIGTFNNITINSKGLATAGNNVSYLTSEVDPIVKAITGIVKSNGTTISAATAGTDYLTPTGSAGSLTDFPILNQNTTGSAASFTGSLAGEVTGTQGATVVENSAVIGKVLTGYVSGAGTVAATDNILQAIQKLNGNNPVHYIGESYGGGIVFYVYDNGRHGLIAATVDQSTGVVWTTAAFQSEVSNAVRDGINGGLTNTERIIIQAGAGTYAAQLCANSHGGNYADWYLPSKYELNLLYAQKSMVGSFASSFYWSSSENGDLYGWLQSFNDGSQYNNYKSATYYVRAIRSF